MKIKNPVLFFWAGALVLALSACGTAPGSSQATRVATQTPWIIYLPVTSTPDIATATTLPTVTPEGGAKTTPPRGSSPTRSAAVRPTATRTPAAVPPTAGPQPTSAPACSAPAVTLLFPDNGAPRTTLKTRPGSDTFDFKWTPFQSGETDPHLGYKIDLVAKRIGLSTQVGADTVYVSHNKFLSDGQHYIYPSNKIWVLPGGENASITWTVTVVKTTGSFSDDGQISGSTVNCGPASVAWSIKLEVLDR